MFQANQTIDAFLDTWPQNIDGILDCLSVQFTLDVLIKE